MTTIEEQLDHRMLRLLRLAERNDGSLNFDFPERKPRCDELVRAGLLKVNVVSVPAKKKRTGIDPFTKVERVFAAKPASVKIKTRALKKLKDAAA